MFREELRNVIKTCPESLRHFLVLKRYIKLMFLFFPYIQFPKAINFFAKLLLLNMWPWYQNRPSYVLKKKKSREFLKISLETFYESNATKNLIMKKDNSSEMQISQTMFRGRYNYVRFTNKVFDFDISLFTFSLRKFGFRKFMPLL